MPLDSKLENYLATLDRVLSPFPVSDRADIVMEIKSHVLSALDREPRPDLDTVLAALGEPEMVANRYLLERGLKPARPPISPVVKWIVIGILGSGALFLVGLAILLAHLSPLVKVDEETGRVRILGGLVDVTEETSEFSFGDGKASSGGKTTLIPGAHLDLQLGKGSFEFVNAPGNTFTWKCRATGGGKGRAAMTSANEQGEIALDLRTPDPLSCRLEIPVGTQLNVRAEQGKLELEKPNFSAKAFLHSGKIEVDLDHAKKYAFALKVDNGRVDQRPSDQQPEHRLDLHVGNGRIDLD